MLAARFRRSERAREAAVEDDERMAHRQARQLAVQFLQRQEGELIRVRIFYGGRNPIDSAKLIVSDLSGSSASG
jgi:hypothetical protein